MKYVFMFMAAVMLLAGAPKSCNQPKDNGGEEPEVVDPDAPTPAATDLIVMVYSNAYDGFLNVREQPDTKSPVIGKILNGPMGAVKMGEVGGWTIVKVGDTVGYASSRYLQTEPTAEFTDKDMEKCLQGIWLGEEPKDYKLSQRVVYLFKNNVIAEGFPVEGLNHVGTWEVKGNALNIHFTDEKWSTWGDADVTENWIVVNGDQIKDQYGLKYKKQSIMSKKAYEEYVESCPGVSPVMWYKSDQENYNLIYEEAHLRLKDKIK